MADTSELTIGVSKHRPTFLAYEGTMTHATISALDCAIDNLAATWLTTIGAMHVCAFDEDSYRVEGTGLDAKLTITMFDGTERVIRIARLTPG